MKRSLASAALGAMLAAGLAAQAPQAAKPAAPAGAALPAPQPAAQTETLPHPARVLWAGLGGAAAGALIGTRGLSFAALPVYERRAHEWRAGLTYGAIGGVLGAAMAARLEPAEGEPEHRFFWDRWNTPLFAGVIAVQGLDYASTRYFRDRGKDEWLLTNSLVDNKTAFAATEVAAAGAAIGLSYLFHRTGHHALERWAAGVYVGFGLTSAVANYRYPATGHALFGN